MLQKSSTGTFPKIRDVLLAELGKEQDWNPLEEVRTFSDLCEKFPYFEDGWLRDLPNEVWVPKSFRIGLLMCLKQVVPPVCPSRGSGGMISESITEFSKTLNDQHFPKNQYWMMVGPTGPLVVCVSPLNI